MPQSIDCNRPAACLKCEAFTPFRKPSVNPNKHCFLQIITSSQANPRPPLRAGVQGYKTLSQHREMPYARPARKIIEKMKHRKQAGLAPVISRCPPAHLKWSGGLAMRKSSQSLTQNLSEKMPHVCTYINFSHSPIYTFFIIYFFTLKA